MFLNRDSRHQSREAIGIFGLDRSDLAHRRGPAHRARHRNDNLMSEVFSGAQSGGTRHSHDSSPGTNASDFQRINGSDSVSRYNVYPAALIKFLVPMAGLELARTFRSNGF